MVVTSSAFIHGRVCDLDIISSGWHFMQKSMSQEDRKGFEKMINMPGFSVEKFEETYLLKKINPFVKSPQVTDEPVVDDHSECPLGQADKQCGFAGMEEKLTQFLAKWEEVFEKFATQLSSTTAPPTDSSIVQKAVELQKKTENQLKAIKVSKGKASQKPVTEEVKSKQTQVQKQAVPKTTTNTKKEVEGQKKSGDVAAVAPKQKETNVKISDSTLTVAPIAPIAPIAEPLKMEHVPAEEKPVLLKCVTEKTEANFENETGSTNGESVTSSLPSPVRDISPSQTNRPLGTPDSGMVSDLTEVKNVAVEASEPTKETVDPEKLTGREGRRYRQKLKKEAEQAALNNADVVEQKEESPEMQTGRTRTESESSTKKGEPTGKEKRRLKDKLRKEKRMQEKETLESEKVATEQEEKVEQAAQNVEQDTANISAASENIASVTEDNIVNPSSEQVDAEQDTPEPAVEEVVAVETNSQQEPELEQQEQQEQQGKQEQQEPEVAAERNGVQEVKLSKSQKKRAKKRANKGVYVVNGKNVSHTVELGANEYKILKIDQSNRIAEICFRGEGSGREVDLDALIQARLTQETIRGPKNYLIAGELTKNILDNGKWLAYVLDEKNPNGVPKIGEVSNEAVEETIKYLNLQQLKPQLATTSEQQPEPIEEYDENDQTDDDDEDDQKALEEKIDREFPTLEMLPPRITPTRQTLPELDADFVRKTFADIEAESREVSYVDEVANNGKEDNDDFDERLCLEDLKMFINSTGANYKEFTFVTEFAERTASLFFGNDEFIEFCTRYSTSKYDPRDKKISLLVRKYIDKRIVYHYERFKKLANRESRRISGCWTHINESSAYSLMVMLFLNSPVSNVGFDDVERVLFSEL